MIYRLLALVALFAASVAGQCDPSLGCMTDADCTPPTAGSCVRAAPTDPLGCCPATTTTTTTTTTAASAVTTTAACADLLNPLTGVSDCPARSNLCTDSVYLEVMQVQCRRTCGFCSNSTSTNSTTCVDLTNPATGVSDCPARTAYCNNTVYSALMRVQCPATCGFCTSG